MQEKQQTVATSLPMPLLARVDILLWFSNDFRHKNFSKIYIDTTQGKLPGEL